MSDDWISQLNRSGDISLSNKFPRREDEYSNLIYVEYLLIADFLFFLNLRFAIKSKKN